MTKEEKVVSVEQFSFDENGYIAVIAQDYESGEVLMFGKMNAEAVAKTFESGYAYYVVDGETKKFGQDKGNVQKLKTAFLTADGKTLLIKVLQHAKADMENLQFSTFSNQIKGEYKEIGGEMFGRLQRIVNEYKQNPEEGAYTSFLFARGVDRIAKKVGEEAVEFVIASKNDEKEGVVNEAADLLYHTMVLLSARGVKISEVCAELCKRNR